MNVDQAVDARHSVRQFLPQPVSDTLIRDLLIRAARAPSGGNLQPWRIFVVNGPNMTRFREYLREHPDMQAPQYDVYPHPLIEPHRTNRFRLGEQLYGILDIPRSDKESRLRQFAKNADFFGAPAALFCFLHTSMGPPQWSDAGMFLQTFMLLATSRGLGTCAQEYWSVYHQQVSDFVGASADLQLFCGMAIGYEDNQAPINTLRSERLALQEWATFIETTDVSDASSS